MNDKATEVNDKHFKVYRSISKDEATGAIKGRYVYVVYEGPRDVTSLVVPEDATYIGPYAFKGCDKLVSVTLPPSVETIDNFAFAGCRSLTSISLPERMIRIGRSAFRDCSALTQFVWPKGVKYVEKATFKGCSGLKSVKLSDDVVSIRRYAFTFCSSLETLNRPPHLVHVGLNAFACCDNLKPDGEIGPNLVNVDLTHVSEDWAFAGNNDLLSVVLPSGTTRIGTGAFCDCLELISVRIPEGVTEIGDDAFRGCRKLSRINLPKSLRAIGCRAFGGCRCLMAIELPPGATDIKEAAFDCCESLQSLSLPFGVDTIADSLFNRCENLLRVEIPASVTCIGRKAFLACRTLTSLTLPNSIKVIGARAFEHCSGLSQIRLPESLTTIEAYAFDSCPLHVIDVPSMNQCFRFEDGVLYGDGGRTVVYCVRDKVGRLTLPRGVTSIQEGAFKECEELTMLELPPGVTEIGAFAFSLCWSLREVMLPDSISHIGQAAFLGCDALERLRIPSHLRKLDTDVLDDFCYIRSLIFPVNGFDIAETSLNGCSELMDIRIPPENPQWIFRDGLLYDRLNHRVCLCVKERTGEVVLPADAQSIDTSAFSGCKGITGVRFPATIERIGERAFGGCTGLTSLELPPRLQTIDSWTFFGCENLESVVLPKGLLRIKDWAFMDCPRLQILVPNSVEEVVAERAFDEKAQVSWQQPKASAEDEAQNEPGNCIDGNPTERNFLSRMRNVFKRIMPVLACLVCLAGCEKKNNPVMQSTESKRPQLVRLAYVEGYKAECAQVKPWLSPKDAVEIIARHHEETPFFNEEPGDKYMVFVDFDFDGVLEALAVSCVGTMRNTSYTAYRIDPKTRKLAALPRKGDKTDEFDYNWNTNTVRLIMDKATKRKHYSVGGFSCESSKLLAYSADMGHVFLDNGAVHTIDIASAVSYHDKDDEPYQYEFWFMRKKVDQDHYFKAMTELCSRYYDLHVTVSEVPYSEIEWGNPDSLRELLLAAYLAYRYDGFSFSH